MVGTVTGIIGAITGLIGSVISVISLRRTQQIKGFDLRLELRKQISTVRSDIEALSALLNRAQLSHTAVLAAMGIGPQSSATKKWQAEFEEDLKTARTLAGELPDAKETYEYSKPQELEDKLVKVHAIEVKGATLRNKYEIELASDEKQHDFIKTYRLRP